MNFFRHQDRARSTTRKLVLLFAGAVIALIIITSFLVLAILYYSGQSAEPGFNQEFMTSRIFILVSLAVLAVVSLGSLYRLSQLRGGGKSVAEQMGGRLLNTATRDADERKILNVVEEMAIASGLPVPPVYLIEDRAINAFAAGYRQQDAVIGITRGCIEQLSREELQGVVAHEFSHIFNGDMRLNIRLIGLLYGIMVIGLIGYYIMRSSVYRSTGRGSRNNRGGGVVLVGLGLVIVGYGGTFFGNMIKAAVSRQREFLADASAVQFTRNPAGISGALKKIGGYTHGSHIRSADASEISHMLFSEGLKASFTGLFSTHPPLPERIRKIEPYWKGDFSETTSRKPSGTPTGAQGFSTEAGISAIDSIGNPGPGHIDLAASSIAGIPHRLLENVHNSFEASVLMYCLLMELSDAQSASEQLRLLESSLAPAHFREMIIIRKQVSGLPRESFLPLVDLALPSLKQLSERQYRSFMQCLTQLILMDSKVSLFEWCLFQILRHNLDKNPPRRDNLKNLEACEQNCEILLSVLAETGHLEATKAKAAFDEAAAVLDLPVKLNFKPQYHRSTEALEAALDQLKRVKPLQKPRLLKAMVTCIQADGKVMPEEGELLRAVGSLLDCPIPPLLSGQKFI